MNNLVSAYMSFCKKILSAYPNSRVIVTNVGPVNEQLAKSNKYNVTNNEIEKFNQKLMSSIEQSKIVSADTTKQAKYCQVLYGDFKTDDGLHYTKETCKTVYEGNKACINK